MKKITTLGEGQTPLLRLSNLEKVLDWTGKIWAKAEYQNPTGSFKDRGSVTEIAQALTLNKKGVVCASTGNMAASLAAYATANNIKCLVVIPQNTPQGKLTQAKNVGAEFVKIAGTYDDCVQKAEILALEKDYLLCGDYELRRIGQSTIGKELAIESTKNNMCIDTYIVPVGNGTLACGIAEGLASYGLFPKLIGVQGEGADPITNAWNQKKSIQKIDSPSTIASAMSVGDPLDGKITLKWVKNTKGQMSSVKNKEILSAQSLLAKTEGLFVETSAAATLAGLIKEKEQLSTLSSILILTGNGLKEN